MDKDYITKTKLKERGWTEGIIKKYLTHPCKTKRNSYNRFNDIKLYYIEKIKHIEESEDFKKDIEKISKRREGAKKAIETKTKKILDYVNNVEIFIPDFKKKEIYNLAIDHYNMNSQSYNIATYNSDKEFLNRITCNFIRHVLTNYEYELSAINNKVGNKEAYIILKERIFESIFEKYPYLKYDTNFKKLF